MYRTKARQLFPPSQITTNTQKLFRLFAPSLYKCKNYPLYFIIVKTKTEMIHSVNNCENITETSVLDRQRSRLKRQQEPLTFFNENAQLDGAFSGFNGDQSLSELLMGGAMKPDPGLDSGLVDGFRDVLNYGNGSEFVMASYSIPRTASCPPNMAAAAADIAQGRSPSSAAVGESSKKRKADKPQNPKVIGTGKTEDKKMKGCKEEESKITEQNSSSKSTTTTVTNNKSTKGPSANTKDNMKNSEYPKADYIHVRARRGQATDSHSLAERVRREKISERMKFLQDLVPGCNRIIGKAGMLDEIINYVQSLQRQVEFLSMKLTTINPTLDFDIDNYLVKEMYPDLVNHGSVQFNTYGQGVLNSSVEMVVNPLDVTLRRTISAPVSIPQAFLDSSGLNQIHHLTWEDELQNIYRMEYQQGQ